MEYSTSSYTTQTPQSQSQSQPDPNQYQYPSQSQSQSQPQPLPYDPTTIQPSYDPHSYYYPSYDPNQHYQYYATTPQIYQDSTSIHPPGVPIPAPPPNFDATHLQNAYYVVDNHLQPVNPGSGQPTVSGITQVEVAPIGQTPYRGGGRRGNRPFRGGGRGHLGYHGNGPDGSAPPSHGRGRGQGGGRHFQLYGTASSNPDSASVQAEGVAALKQPPSALVPLQAPLPVPTQVSSASFWQLPRMAWCELCRVDCNTLETLEQHKNGKRHKKILQVHEELQKLNKVNTEQHNAQMPNTELKPEVGQTEKVEETQPSEVKLTSEVVTDGNRNETDQRETAGSSEIPENKSRDHFAARGCGSKRRGRGGRGGKYMRTHEGSRRVAEPPKLKMIPFICELCNVKCESQVVFDSHLSGKKHLATLKRFQSHRALYGEQGLQALYPPNITVVSTSVAPHAEQVVPHVQQVAPHVEQAVPHVQQVSPQVQQVSPQVQQCAIDPQVFLAQVQQGDNDPEALLGKLLMSYMLSKTQAQEMTPAPGPTSAVATSSGMNIETQNQLQSQIQGLLAMCQNAAIASSKSQPQTFTMSSEAPASGCTDSKEASVPKNNPVVAPPEIPPEIAGPSTQVSDKECEVIASKPEPEPVNQMQEAESKKE